jgi:hypothetical protein
MTTRKFSMGLLIAASLLAVGGVQAADIDVTVEVDEATVSDAQMLEFFMNEAESGKDVPRAMRGLAMQLVGEASSALESQRIDEYEQVVLDDGSSVAMAEEDSLFASVSAPSGNGATVRIGFEKFRTPSGRIHRRACSISVCTPSGQRITVSVPASGVERGPDDNIRSKCKAVPVHCVIPH